MKKLEPFDPEQHPDEAVAGRHVWAGKYLVVVGPKVCLADALIDPFLPSFSVREEYFEIGVAVAECQWLACQILFHDGVQQDCVERDVFAL